VPWVMSLIENNFKWKNVQRDFNVLILGWAMILEQYHRRATNYKRIGHLYCYCGCVVISILILSIAYKADNIRNQITNSCESVPITNMAQVKNAGYKTRTIKVCAELLESYFCDDLFYIEANFSKRRHQFIDDKRYKLWEPMDSIVYNHSWFNIIGKLFQNNLKQLQDSVFDLNAEFFGECEKQALLGWRSSLVRLEQELREEYKNAHIYVGKEFIFSRHFGWQLQRYGNVKVLKRMYTIVESGVHGKLLNVSYKPRADRRVFQPRPLAIHGNISVPIVFHSLGLLLAIGNFISQAHTSITLWFHNSPSVFRIKTLFYMNP